MGEDYNDNEVMLSVYKTNNKDITSICDENYENVNTAIRMMVKRRVIIIRIPVILKTITTMIMIK